MSERIGVSASGGVCGWAAAAAKRRARHAARTSMSVGMGRGEDGEPALAESHCGAWVGVGLWAACGKETEGEGMLGEESWDGFGYVCRRGGAGRRRRWIRRSRAGFNSVAVSVSGIGCGRRETEEKESFLL